MVENRKVGSTIVDVCAGWAGAGLFSAGDRLMVEVRGAVGTGEGGGFGQVSFTVTAKVVQASQNIIMITIIIM